MEKKIAALRAAYAEMDMRKVHKAACAIVNHDAKHPFAILTLSRNLYEVFALAQKIAAVPVEKLCYKVRVGNEVIA